MLWIENQYVLFPQICSFFAKKDIFHIFSFIIAFVFCEKQVLFKTGLKEKTGIMKEKLQIMAV